MNYPIISQEAFDIKCREIYDSLNKMCQTNHWKRIEAKLIPNNPFEFQLIGMRSDGIICTSTICIAQESFSTVDKRRLVALPGMAEFIANQINQFEILRSVGTSEHTERTDS